MVGFRLDSLDNSQSESGRELALKHQAQVEQVEMRQNQADADFVDNASRKRPRDKSDGAKTPKKSKTSGDRLAASASASTSSSKRAQTLARSANQDERSPTMGREIHIEEIPRIFRESPAGSRSGLSSVRFGSDQDAIADVEDGQSNTSTREWLPRFLVNRTESDRLLSEFQEGLTQVKDYLREAEDIQKEYEDKMATVSEAIDEAFRKLPPPVAESVRRCFLQGQ